MNEFLCSANTYASMPDGAYKVRCADCANFSVGVRQRCPFGIWHCPSSWQVHNFSINASRCKQTKQAEGFKKKAGQKKQQTSLVGYSAKPGRKIVMQPTWHGSTVGCQGSAPLHTGRAAQSAQLSTQAQQHLNANANGHKA